jgi:hypothetical protein
MNWPDAMEYAREEWFRTGHRQCVRGFKDWSGRWEYAIFRHCGSHGPSARLPEGADR